MDERTERLMEELDGAAYYALSEEECALVVALMRENEKLWERVGDLREQVAARE